MTEHGSHGLAHIHTTAANADDAIDNRLTTAQRLTQLVYHLNGGLTTEQMVSKRIPACFKVLASSEYLLTGEKIGS